MKRLFSLLFFFFVLAAVLTGMDYAELENWAIAEPDKTETTFDLFYVYPTLVASAPGGLMDWHDKEVADKTVSFSRAQTGIFGAHARVFAPYVRQSPYDVCIQELKRTPVEFASCETGMRDAVEAFRHYWKTWRKPGRPLILLGHSQGSVDLYAVLMECKEISVENGFVAAYLPGLPGAMTQEKFLADFAGRSFRSPGVAGAEADEFDSGAILFWNTQSRDAEPSPFRTKRALVANPLNWSATDAAPAERNLGAYLYDYRTKTAKTVPGFCGAEPDGENGVLIVALPANSEWDAYGFMGKGVFHQNDVWFFAENIAKNALARAERWLRAHGDSSATSANANGTAKPSAP